MTNIISAIIFDSDDTLLDFSCVASPVIQEAAKRLQMRVPELDEINKLWGMPLQLFIKELIPDVDVEAFKKHYYSIMEEKPFVAIDGAPNTVKELHSNFVLGVLTTKIERLMTKHFNEAGFDLSLFRFLHGAEHSPYRKPDPKVFDKSLEILNIEPERVLYVGDSMFDYEAAKGAGLNFVAVETGFFNSTDFVKNGISSDNVIESIKNLPDWLKKQS